MTSIRKPQGPKNKVRLLREAFDLLFKASVIARAAKMVIDLLI